MAKEKNFIVSGRFVVVCRTGPQDKELKNKAIRAKNEVDAWLIVKQLIALDSDIVIPIQYACVPIAHFDKSQGVFYVP